MTEPVEFRLNKATPTEIADHLAESDDAFIPRLSERVQISDYALKIAGRAERFEAWAEGRLVGLIAAYFNDVDARMAYITSVSVAPGYRNRGLASRLLGECIEFAQRREFSRLSLDVDRENSTAMKLYEARGFTAASVDGRTIRMLRDMREDVDMGSQS